MGANFKETGVYMNLVGRNRVRDRLHAFPFIEPGESFVTTDATVYYLSNEASPRQIKADSPNAQVLISLRDPMSRCFSQYRYAFNNATESFKSAVEEAIPIMGECYRRHLEGVDLKALLCVRGRPKPWSSGGIVRVNVLTVFLLSIHPDGSRARAPSWPTTSATAPAPCSARPPAAPSSPPSTCHRYAHTHTHKYNRAWLVCMYVCSPNTTNPTTHPYPPQLLAWVDTFGRERVHVVTKEAMEHAPQAVLAEAYQFLGLCEPQGDDAKAAMELTRENVRDGLPVPAGYGLEEADMLDLSEAFQPWNQALYAFLEKDLAWPVS